MASKMATPRYCTQHSRFKKQDGWRFRDLSLSLNGNIAVTGDNKNTRRTCIDVYTNVRHSDSRDKPKIVYSKEFDKYLLEGRGYFGRRVSFYPGSDTTILSGLGDKLEVIDLIQDRVIKSRKIELVKHGDLFGQIYCLSVRETEIFIGFKSSKITIYDVINLNKIKSIILQGIQAGYFPYDMTAIADRIFVCVGDGNEGSNHKSLIFEEKNGRILSELTKPADTVEWYGSSVGVNMSTLGIAAVKWYNSYNKKEDRHRQIVLYSLLSENNCSFLIVEVESGVGRIRISDRGDRMITGNKFTGEVKVYDMAEVFTYSHLKEKLASALQTDECTKLANFFKIPKDQADGILRSDRPSENLFLALEKKGILQSYNVERLKKAFEELTINPFCSHVAEIFLKTRSPIFYIELIQKLEEKIIMVQTASKDETRQLKEPRLKITQERDKFKAAHDEGQLQLFSLQQDLEASKKAKMETERVLREKKTEVADLEKELKDLRKRQEAQLKITQERDKFKAEHDQDQLQLFSLQKDLEASKKAKIETEKVLREKSTEVADLQKELKDLRKRQEAQLKITQERDKLKTEHDQGQLQLFSLQKELEASKKAQIETERVLRAEVEDLQKELRKLKEAHLKITQERDKFKAEHDEGQLQLSSLQEELEVSKNTKTRTEKVLKQTEELLLQKMIQEKNEIKSELKQVQVAHSLESMSLEEGRKNQAESGKKTLGDTTTGEFSTPSPDKSNYLPESVLEDEFSKVIVKVSTRLTRTNCVYLARYFNFSPAKAAAIQEESKTPGLDLLDAMKERNIINMYDVTELQKALVDLDLKEINETLVSPYHRKIDPRIHERHKVFAPGKMT